MLGQANGDFTSRVACPIFLLTSDAHSEKRFDVVLSDIVMPGDTNGLALARAVRKSDPGMPIVLMTGYSAELSHALAEGFEVLPKPCNAVALLDGVKRALERR